MYTYNGSILWICQKKEVFYDINVKYNIHIIEVLYSITFFYKKYSFIEVGVIHQRQYNSTSLKQ